VIKPDQAERVAATLQSKGPLPPDIVSALLRSAVLARFGSGQDLMAVGDRVEAVPVIISGSVRVFWTGASGREITLYRFGPGECCVLSADSILGNRLFPARAQVAETVEVVFIPASLFNQLLARSPEWRARIFGAMSDRLLSLMGTLDEVAFGHMDTRVAALLVQRAGNQAAVLNITHQQIADELGSAREVVSRVLEELRSRGLLRLGRGSIELVDPAGLDALVVG
jgi:CRP/FNR family transcriptional regulator, anaerobic regulatory protein